MSRNVDYDTLARRLSLAESEISKLKRERIGVTATAPPLSYAFCAEENVVLTASSTTISAYQEAYEYGSAFTIDGSLRISVAQTGVYVAMARVSMPLAISEEWNATITLSTVDLTPPTGTLVPNALGWWQAESFVPDASGDFFRTLGPVYPFALADAADVPNRVDVRVVKAGSTDRTCQVGLYVIRLGDATTS